MKRYIFLIVMAQIAFTVCADRKVADNPLFEDDFNNIGNYTANWEKLSNDAPGLVEYISGDDGDGYIKIASDDRTSQGIKHKLTGLKPPACPIYQNVDAAPHTDPEQIKRNLIAQLTAPVRWTQIVRRMLEEGVDAFTELGPGTVLQGLIRKVSAEAAVESKSTLEA